MPTRNQLGHKASPVEEEEVASHMSIRVAGVPFLALVAIANFGCSRPVDPKVWPQTQLGAEASKALLGEATLLYRRGARDPRSPSPYARRPLVVLESVRSTEERAPDVLRYHPANTILPDELRPESASAVQSFVIVKADPPPGPTSSLATQGTPPPGAGPALALLVADRTARRFTAAPLRIFPADDKELVQILQGLPKSAPPPLTREPASSPVSAPATTATSAPAKAGTTAPHTGPAQE